MACAGVVLSSMLSLKSSLQASRTTPVTHATPRDTSPTPQVKARPANFAGALTSTLPRMVVESSLKRLTKGTFQILAWQRCVRAYETSGN